MNGIELSRGYFEQFGLPMLESQFKDILPLLAVGSVGGGSDRFGFDDIISRDHDFEPGFCIFIPDEAVLSRRDAFLLERAYAKLPDEYLGIKRLRLSPVGGNRNGVILISDFYSSLTGSPDGRLDLHSWLTIPDHFLAMATNGEIYFDNYGLFTETRERLLNMPESIRRKRLAGNLLLAAQAGQYNFERCLQHGESDAAKLASFEFVQSAMKAVALINRVYLPYYKWSFRALRRIPGGEEIAGLLSDILAGDCRDASAARNTAGKIEEVSSRISAMLLENGLSSSSTENLKTLAYIINDSIADGEVRNLNILAAV